MPDNASFKPSGSPPAAPNAGGTSKGGLLNRIFENNQGKWLIGLGVVTLIVMIVYLRRQNSQAAANVTGNAPTSGQGQGQGSPDQMWGSQLETDYQQMISNQNTTNGLLQQMMNQLSNPSGNPPGGSSQTPPNTPPSGTYDPYHPIVKQGVPVLSHMGDLFTNEGITYEINPGPAGRIWGVPIQPGHPISIQQLQNTPVGPGQKVLLTAPSSYYTQHPTQYIPGVS